MSSDEVPSKGTKDPVRRKLLGAGLAGAAIAGSVAGYYVLKSSVGNQSAGERSPGTPGPSFGSQGIELPSLPYDPPHKEGSIYFRSDLLEIILDDGISYYIIPKKLAFSKGGAFVQPVPQNVVVWRAPFACTATAVRAYQDVGSGSVVTACDGAYDLLATDITLSEAGAWQDGGPLTQTAISEGDSISLKVVSVAGSPNYLVVQVEFTQP